MSTISFRIDYAKFLFTVRPEEWNHIYRVFCETSHQVKFAGEFLKSHKTNRLWVTQNFEYETWSLEVWGEWAGLANELPDSWQSALKRLDVRAIVWDANDETIITLGQHLQRNVTSHNIYVYATKPATKRLGRDRGGKGFAIGSHKSDLRVACYKRTGEPVAQEFQVSGAMLARLVKETRTLIGTTSSVRSAWRQLRLLCEREGNKRLMRVLESAGVGTYWPIVGAGDIPQLPPTQGAFLAELGDIADEHDI